ncbi:heterogeneous nuclear ribonucleoprotein L-like isoform X2 [Vespa velutina]|uniref:heterogeneous nuclear ribonucleoprotein L-like isoform X2 n=1 Tax=Vespa velutina TaxID=202808 RepID=UPI001FB4186D|nr:heterogeneous nuclear ribonucleoprotein L-like isoform X2 [Vespa velutina]
MAFSSYTGSDQYFRQPLDKRKARGERNAFSNHEYGGYGDEPRRKREDNNKPNHVLLFTIINPVYPITVEVLHAISAPSGQVQRIVIFKKNGVQAMFNRNHVRLGRISHKSKRNASRGGHIFWLLHLKN